MPLHLITSENLRNPLGPLLDSIIERHIAHRLADNFLILTPDETSAQDLISHFLRDPRLGGVLTGESLLSFRSWLMREALALHPRFRPAPSWAYEAFFGPLSSELFEENFKNNPKNSKNLSVGSLFQLIQAFRNERMGPEAIRSFVAGFDPDLAADCFALAKRYFEGLDSHELLHDTTWAENRILKGFERGEVEGLKKIKTLYWLGFSHITPELKTFAPALESFHPQLEQILLIQTPRGIETQDFIAAQWGGRKEVYHSQGRPSEKPQTRFFEFPGPFDEAGFILEKIHRLVEEGAAPHEIAVFLPSDPFWERYFSNELEKLGLLPAAFHPRRLSSFASVAFTLSNDPFSAVHNAKDSYEQLQKKFTEGKKALTENSKDHEDTALEISALHQWMETLEEVSFYQSALPDLLKRPVSLSRIAQTTFLDEKRSPHAGVALRNHKQAGLTRFPYAFAFQLIDRSFPQGPERFFGFPLPNTARSPAAERAQFQHLLGAAGRELFLSFSTHGAQGEENSPSPFLTEFGIDPPEPLRRRPFFAARIPSQDFERRRQIERQRERDTSYRHPFGGFLQDPKILSLLQERLKNHLFSPSQLENYARCPFRFFAGSLLKLKAPLEKNPDGNAAERGEWLHRFLETFFRENREEIRRARKDRLLQEELTQKVPQLLASLSEGFLKEKPWIHETLSKDFMGRASLTVQGLLLELWEKMNLSEKPFLPALFEKTFGKGEIPPLTFPNPGHPPLKIGGRVDRIDLTEDGREFLVFDYKTGETGEITNELQRFKAFQLPIYLLAAKEIVRATHASPLQNVEGRGALAISLKDQKTTEGMLKAEEKKRFGFKGRKALLEDEEWRLYFQKLNEELLKIHSKILSGDFRTAPDPCDAYCDFRTICRYHDREKLNR